MKSTQYLQLFVIAISVLLFSACSDDDDGGINCTEPTSKFSFRQNQSILLNPQAASISVNDTLIFISEYRVTDGPSLVFNFFRGGSFCEGIADSGGFNEFFMEVPADSINTFSYTDLEIIETSAFYSLNVPWSLPHHSIEEGEIFGTRIDENTWQVSIDVITKPQEFDEDGFGPQQITIDAEYSLQ